METKLLPCTDEAIREAAELIRSGQVAAFPTETVYGLGANALDPDAVARIFLAKGRPGDNPLIVHISAMEELVPLIRGELSPAARTLADRFWPGPMTMILPKADRIPSNVSAGLDTVGIRMPLSADARRFIRACMRPIAAPSANRSGRPSPTTAAHVLEDMDGRIPLILDGGPCTVGLESTVVDVTGPVPRILRPGGITPEMIREAVGGCLVDDTVLRPVREGERVRSPGMKYRHYAPKGDLTIVEGDPDRVAARICAAYDGAGEGALILALRPHLGLYGDRRTISLGEDAGDMAQHLFDALREADEMGAARIFSEAVPVEGIGLAVMNRLGRAAAFRIEKV